MPSRAAARVLAVAAAIFVALAEARSAAADPVAACHCFRERTYDPRNPAAADPYILATARSSTLAAVFGAEKASLVRVVMKGTPADDLWIAHWAGARLRDDAMRLLQEKRASGSWRTVLERRDATRLGAEFRQQLARGSSDARLAAVAVDDVAVSHLRAAPDLVRVTRDAGAGSPELLLTLILAPRMKLGPADILALVRDGRSWGALLAEAAITPAEIDDVVKAAIRPPPAQTWLLK